MKFIPLVGVRKTKLKSEARSVVHTYVCTSLLLILLFVSSSLPAQERYGAKVNVDAEKIRNVMAFRALSVDSMLWDGNLTTPETAQLLRAIGVTTVRYPAGFANRYHWSTHKTTPIHGTDSTQTENFPAGTDFGHFARLLDRLDGTAIITVNYGTNIAGTGGGEPAEAAAWVAYANGDPADPKTIGKDSTGYDWKTVGFWAGIRSAEPLPNEDGFNFLRIAHPQPLKIKYWEIGNEVFANGYYAKDGKNDSEEDLHAPYGKDTKESEKLRSHNAKLSPSAYGNAVVEFAKAMKAVDPTIKIGAVLVPPPLKDAYIQPGAHFERWNGEGAQGQDKRLVSTSSYLTGVGGNYVDTSQMDWNPGVMKACASSIDFVIVHWRFAKFLPPDWKTLDSAGTLQAPYSDLPEIMKGLVELLSKYGGTNARNLQLAFTGVSAFGSDSDQNVQSLFLTDAYASLIESGSLATVGIDAHGQGFLDGSNKPGPLAYALGMIHILARPNDSLVESESNSQFLAVHTARRADGSLGMMLINKDATKTATVKVAIKNVKVAAKAARFDFGKNTNGLPVKSAVEAGENFTVDVPPYTVVDLLLPKAQ